MKKIVLIACLLLTVNLYAQTTVKKFKVINRMNQSIPEKMYPLMNEKGEILGNYYISMFQDKSPEITVIRGNSEFIIKDPLSYVVLPSKSDLIVNCGDYIYSHILNNFHLRIINKQGLTLTHKENAGKFPFSTSFSAHGDIYCFANTSTSLEHEQYSLKKYNKNLLIEWQTEMPLSLPQFIRISNDESFIAVSYQDRVINTFGLQVFNSRGKKISETNLDGITAIEFLNNNSLIVCDYTNWYIYESAKNLKPLFKGSLKGNPLGAFPITSSAKSDWFVVITYISDNQVNLEVIDTNNGKLLASGNFDAAAYWEPYRYVSVDDNDVIHFFNGTELIKIILE